MKPTNYHLFDFLDFDPDLSRDESLWKAYKPTSVYEKDGDICINVPFQKQVLSNDMAPDTASPREEYTLVIRQYTSGITRFGCGRGGDRNRRAGWRLRGKTGGPCVYCGGCPGADLCAGMSFYRRPGKNPGELCGGCADAASQRDSGDS